jgi:mannose-6-phosphate isomerase-like protein (cupin superfamily)
MHYTRSLFPGEHIGVETHDVDQFFRVEQGTGEVLIDGHRSPIGAGSAVVFRPAASTTSSTPGRPS